MAFQAKFTVIHGKPNLKDVAVAAGSAEAQSDTISVNIDQTRITKGTAVRMLNNLIAKIHAGPWPPL